MKIKIDAALLLAWIEQREGELQNRLWREGVLAEWAAKLLGEFKEQVHAALDDEWRAREIALEELLPAGEGDGQKDQG